MVEPLTLTQLGACVTRRWRIVVLGCALAAVIGAGVHSAMPERYEAVAVVHVDAADPEQIDMATEEAVATSRRVTSEALDALGRPRMRIAQLEAAVTARAVEESRLLRISYAASSPQLAARGADAVAHAYLAVRAVDAMQRPDQPGVSGVVVDPARLPRAPTGPGGVATTLGAMVIGLLIATPIAARPTRIRAARAS